MALTAGELNAYAAAEETALSKRVRVEVAGDVGRFLTKLDASHSNLAKQMAAVSNSNLGKQIAALQGAKIAAGHDSQFAAAVAGLRKHSQAFEAIRKTGEAVAQALASSKLQELVRAQGQVLGGFTKLQGIGGISSETIRGWGKALHDLERSKRLAMARYRRAAALIGDLPEDARLGATREVLSVLATGDGRRIARLVRSLQRRADRNVEAGTLLRWLIAILELLAVHAFAQQLAAIVTIVDRWIAYHLGRLEWRLRAPDRHTDPVANRRCANAPNAASVMEAAAA